MKVYSAIAAVMSDLSKIGIGKEKKNAQQGFMYRGVDDVMNALAPIISKHGLVILPRVTKREIIERQSKSGGALFYVTLDMEFDFVAAEDASKHVVGPIIGEAMDSGDKASNKAMSIAYKYACFQAFCIPTEGDNDPDEQSHEIKWDGRVQVGFSKNYKDAMWRDVPQDFLDWCNDPKNRLSQQAKQRAASEKQRRVDEAKEFNQEIPDSWAGARQ